MRTRTLKSVLAGGVCALALTTAAHAENREFAVPAGELSQALDLYIRQSGEQLIYRVADVRGMKTSGVSGALSTEEALARLLEGTSLTIKRDPSGLIAVASVDTPAPQSGSAAGGGAEVEALIVTAQKREEDIQDVPIAISAFSQEDLTRSQVAGGPDLITQVPNMTFTKTNFSSYSVQLRGIGTQAISATTDPAVAVAFNNTPFIRNRFFEQEFYDLQRVEVLRGPQGTLYGRNATAGVVNIISAKPKFNFEAKASADIANYNSSRIEAMVNVPLVEDALALRLAGAWTKRDGYAVNELTGTPIDGRDLWSTRVSLRVSPNDRIDANLIWEHFEEDDDRLRSGKQLCKKHVVTEVGGISTPNFFQTLPDSGQSGLTSGVQATFSQGCERESLYSTDTFQTPNGLMLPYYAPLSLIGLPTALQAPYVSEVQSSNLRAIESTVDPRYSAEADLGELQVSLDLTDELTLTSETAYGTDSVYSLQDFNRFNTAPGAWENTTNNREGVLTPGPNGGGIFCDPQLGCSDRLVAVDVSTARARQFSQEFRLSSDFDGSFNFSVGANYLRADSEDKYYVFINSLSLYAAQGSAFAGLDPYVVGVSDNSECLSNGYLSGDPDGVYSVTGCVYIDPNPIDQVNDLGHNYFLSKNPYKLISYAVFGEAYYQLTDLLKVTAGLRWTVDKKDAPRIPTWVLASESIGYPVAEVIEQEWREPTGRLTIDWKPDLAFTDETLLYASYAHGYKAGGANPPGFVRVFYADPEVATINSDVSATRPKTFDPEFIDAYEIGSKNAWADGKVTLNLAAFYYNYNDYQISEIVDRSAFNRNFDATVWGVELEADWRPLENLRLGFKGGHQQTEIADGEEAVDLMDRTAGDDEWAVVRPFPTYASSCILPVYVFNYSGSLINPGGISGGNPGACEEAYLQGLDPVTNLPFVQNPTQERYGTDILPFDEDYPGFDPLSAPNGGEGISKRLGGNDLPNAPNWTWTLTGDYTLPLAGEWLATLHTDLHWQAESWWRVFNDHEYDKLDEYFTMNLAAIFTNEEAGWNIMAYIKNVTDETAITGAFLNSDDTGLTTNVFLTEPRLYGLRVTKRWEGGPLLGSFGERRDSPYPWTVELGGQVQRHDAPSGALMPEFAEAFSGPLAIFDDAQARDLDWGDGREVKVTWRPTASPWRVSLGVRGAETNGASDVAAEELTDPVCIFGGPFAGVCEAKYDDPGLAPFIRYSKLNRADASTWENEEHEMVDFAVGRDLGVGPVVRSSVNVGLRYATLESQTKGELRGIPNWNIPEGLLQGFGSEGGLATRTLYDIQSTGRRNFSGLGPVASWDGSWPLVTWAESGSVSLDWSFGVGILFGERETSIRSDQLAREYELTGFEIATAGIATNFIEPVRTIIGPSEPIMRTDEVSAPLAELGVGLSYSIGGARVSAGYRWERYFDVLDVGYDKHQDADRTIDGPYFKIAVGFGG